MTDKFEDWLLNRIAFAEKQTKEEMGLLYFYSISGRKKAFEDALKEYQAVLAEQSTKDASFISHIQSHLGKDQVVICKICGKTAEEIVKNDR